MNHDFFNSIGNKLNDSLYNLDKSIHNNIRNTFIDDFIHELRDMFHRDIRDNIIDDRSYVKLRENGFYYTFDNKDDCLKN